MTSITRHTIAVVLLGLIFVGAHSARADPQASADADNYRKARAVIADLERIVAPSGIQESYKVRIGGIDQWINVRGQDRANPILLLIHGGPASPAMPTMWQFQRPLEEYFTVVNWDQRGAGKTYGEADPKVVAESLHIARYVDDAVEVAKYLNQRYHKEKIILMGHSWGTIIGFSAALKRPDLFYAYVGIGQVISTRENERISFDYALAQATAHHNADALAELSSIAPYPGKQPITRERIIVARKWPQFYGGMSAFRPESSYYFDGPLLSPEYDRADVHAIDAGSLLTLDRILPEFVSVDFSPVRTFPIPVLMFMGRHDYTTPTAPTAAWLDNVKAPYKQAVWFEHSAHMIPWEEPGKMLVSLLRYVLPLTEVPAPAK
jgi:pimeloyl-ACP methyl ester carboxylesterase